MCDISKSDLKYTSNLRQIYSKDTKIHVKADEILSKCTQNPFKIQMVLQESLKIVEVTIMLLIVPPSTIKWFKRSAGSFLFNSIYEI